MLCDTRMFVLAYLTIFIIIFVYYYYELAIKVDFFPAYYQEPYNDYCISHKYMTIISCINVCVCEIHSIYIIRNPPGSD